MKKVLKTLVIAWLLSVNLGIEAVPAQIKPAAKVAASVAAKVVAKDNNKMYWEDFVIKAIEYCQKEPSRSAYIASAFFLASYWAYSKYYNKKALRLFHELVVSEPYKLESDHIHNLKFASKVLKKLDFDYSRFKKSSEAAYAADICNKFIDEIFKPGRPINFSVHVQNEPRIIASEDDKDQLIKDFKYELELELRFIEEVSKCYLSDEKMLDIAASYNLDGIEAMLNTAKLKVKNLNNQVYAASLVHRKVYEIVLSILNYTPPVPVQVALRGNR